MYELVEMVDFQRWGHLFKLPMPMMHESEVIEFYEHLMYIEDVDTILAIVKGVDFILDVASLGQILKVPVDGISTVKDQNATIHFMRMIGKLEENLKSDRMFKKQMKPRYHLLFELVNKVLLLHTEWRSLASIQDIYIMEALATFHPDNLPAIIIENILKIHSIKDGRHGLGFSYMLTRVFTHFGIVI